MDELNSRKSWHTLPWYLKVGVVTAVLVGIIVTTYSIVSESLGIASTLTPTPIAHAVAPPLTTQEPCQLIQSRGFKCTSDGLVGALTANDGPAIKAFVGANFGGGWTWHHAAANDLRGLDTLLSELLTRGNKLEAGYVESCGGGECRKRVLSPLSVFKRVAAANSASLCTILKFEPSPQTELNELQPWVDEEEQELTAWYAEQTDESVCERNRSYNVRSEQMSRCLMGGFQDRLEQRSNGTDSCLERMCRANIAEMKAKYPSLESYLLTGPHRAALEELKQAIADANRYCNG